MNPGFYHWRDGGEKHMNDPMSVANLQVQCYKNRFREKHMNDPMSVANLQVQFVCLMVFNATFNNISVI